MQAHQRFVYIGDAGLLDEFAQDVRVIEKVSLEVCLTLEQQFVDDPLDGAVILFLYPEWHLLEQGVVALPAFRQIIRRDLIFGHIL